MIQEMIAILQEDLPYIVLTEDPYLEAYNADAIANVERLCPAETGDAFCQQVSYEPLLTLEPGEGLRGGGVDRRPRRRGRDRRGDRRRSPASCSGARAGGARPSRWSSKREREARA